MDEPRRSSQPWTVPKPLPRVAPALPEPDSGGNEEAAPPSVSAGQDGFSSE